MPRIERMREVLAGRLTKAELDKRAADGWDAVAVVWQREVADGRPVPANITEPVPYGLKISEDCVALEQDIQEKPLTEIAASLNQRGFLTRQKNKWTPGAVFDLLPRLIEVGPRVFTSEEWVVRRGRLMNVV